VHRVGESADEFGKFWGLFLALCAHRPVRKGFVEQPEHRKYSSAKNWLLDDRSIIEIQKLNCTHVNGAEAPLICTLGCEAQGDQ
jgi:hypothetical protein